MFNSVVAKLSDVTHYLLSFVLPAVNLWRVRSWLLNPRKQAEQQSYPIKFKKVKQSSGKKVCSFLFSCRHFLLVVVCLFFQVEYYIF